MEHETPPGSCRLGDLPAGGPPCRTVPAPAVRTLVVLALLVPAPAQAQVQQSVWSSTLTVDDDPFGSGCDNAVSRLADCSDRLSPEGFSYDGTAYKVVELQYIAPSLHLELDKAIPSKIRSTGRLTVGDTVLSFSGATFSAQNKLVMWSNSGLSSWTDNQEVSLSLTVSANTVSFSGASPNPVREGRAVNVNVTITPAPGSDLAIPVTVTRVSSEPGDHSTISSISVSHLDGTGSAQIFTRQDDDADHEVFTVAFGTLPSGIVAGNQNSVSVTIIDDEANPDALQPPANVRAEPGNGQVTLHWTAVPGARGYRYQVSAHGRTVRNDWFSGSYGTDTSGVVTGLTNGTEYTFRVRAVKRGPGTRYIQWVSGPDSGPVTATPNSPLPAQCFFRLAGNGSVTGSWSTGGCTSLSRGGRYANWYEFTLAERRQVTIYLQSDTDPYLFLRRGTARSGASFAYNDDGGPGLNSRIVRTLDAGTWTIEATTFGPAETGAFTLALSGAAPTADRQGEEQTATRRGESAPAAPVTPTAPELRIADARGNEGSPYNSGEIHFPVTLAPAQSGSVGVCWRTRDGTARGDYYGRYGDYDAGSGCMYFAAGETLKYVSVRLIGDWHDEGDETFFVDLEDARGATIADGEATGTIVNDGPLQREWLSRFGRSVAGQVIEALEGRFATGAGAPSHLTIAGQRLDFSQAPPPLQDDGWQDHWRDEGTHATSGETHGMDTRELLLGSSFRFTVGEVSGPGGAMTGWGKALTGSSSGSPSGGLTFTSETVTGVLGVDWERRNLLVGLALSESVETGSAAGRHFGYGMEGSLSLVTPYARLRASDRLSFWTMIGSGRGEMSLSFDDARQRADIALRLVAAGGRADLLRPEPGGGFALALKTDAFFVRSESASVSTPGVGNLAGAASDASRVRAVLEGSRSFALPGGGSVEPSLTLGLRHDGGDAETGSGVEVGAGLAWSDPVRGLTSDLRVYGLAAHEDAGYDEWGLSGSLNLAPDASGRGLTLAMTPSWGAQAQTGRVWATRPSALVDAVGGEQPGARLDAEVGYGLALAGGLTGTPYVGLGLGENRDVRLGWRLGSGRWQSFSLGIEASRYKVANGDAPEHRIGVETGLRW